MNVCIPMRISMWGLNDSISCHSSGINYPVCGKRVSHWPGTHWLGQNSLPSSLKGPSISTFPALGLQVNSNRHLT